MTLEIDGIQFKPEASSKEVKVSSSSRKCRLPRFNVIIERSLPVIAANCDELRPAAAVIGELFLRNGC